MQTKAFLVHFTRAVYAMNWFNIAPGLYYIAADFQVKIVTLGLLTTAFYLGVAAFQLPSGILAGRYGNRIIGGIGVLILGTAVFLSGFSPNVLVLGILRLTEGFGSALFFAPALSTLKSIVNEENYGFHINLYNGAFNVGAGLGVVLWNYIDIWIGWRLGFNIAGIITVATGLLYLFVLRNTEEITRKGQDLIRNISTVLKSKSLWILSLGGMGTMIGEIVVGQLLVYYLETAFHFTAFQAMMADALFLLVGFVGGILGGLFTRRFGVGKKLFASVNAVLSLLLLTLAYFDSTILLYFIAFLLGIITVQSFSMLYVMVGVSQKDKSMLAFSLSLVNFIQLGIGGLFPSIFGLIHHSYNYVIAWIVLSASGIAFLLILTFYKPARKPAVSVSV